ncbi:MAG TPA: Atrophin-1 multi-domain protein [Janthinobacterium sp.]|nr:Atrophin-1 multi-domain protein [Janthinobacterium sp.]
MAYGQAIASDYGTYLKMFAADSLWNSRPINPKLGTYQIPATTYNPAISSGAYSSAIFEAKPGDSPMVVHKKSGSLGIKDSDAEQYLDSVRVPHWPAKTFAATGNDGHADIVDAAANRVYSFYQLAQDKTSRLWTASMISWSTLNGSGWGDPAHYYQGARAAAVPTSAGMIRVAEANDGKAWYEHALALSLDYSGLAAAPNQFIYPATSGDSTDPSKSNTGQIPEGARLMLPADFDLSQITDPRLLKVAKTLMRYGAYVVDRNDNTPFVIYVENRSVWSESPPSQLNLVRQALRQVVSEDGYIDGNGVLRVPDSQVNLMSMRGIWAVDAMENPNDVAGVYDTYTQSLRWDTTTSFIRQIDYGNRNIGAVPGVGPNAPKRYTFSVVASGGVKLSMQIYVNKALRLTTALLGNGQSQHVVWPAGATVTLTAEKPAGGPASAKARLVELPPGQ